MKRIQLQVIQLLSILISWNCWNPPSKHKIKKFSHFVQYFEVIYNKHEWLFLSSSI